MEHNTENLTSATIIADEEIIFKIKYKSLKLMAYGLIFFSIFKNSKVCGFKQALVSLKPNFLQDLNIENNWELIKEKIFSMSINKSDQFNQPMIEDVMTVISAVTSEPEFLEEMLYNALQEKFGALTELLKSKLADVIPGRIEIQIEIEKIDLSKAKETKKEQRQRADAIASPPVKNYEFPKFILMSYIEDKLLGKKIGALKPNDKVILKIDDDSIPETALSKIPSHKFGLCYATFVEFYQENNLKYAVFNLGNEIFGRFPVMESNSSVRIKMVLNKKNDKLDSLRFIKDNSLTFYMLVIIIAIILCFLTIQYYAWVME